MRMLTRASCQYPLENPTVRPTISEGRYQMSCIKLNLPENQAGLVKVLLTVD
jgi:hypothetical protein